MSKKESRMITPEEEATLKLVGQTKEFLKVFLMIQLALVAVLLVGYAIYTIAAFIAAPFGATGCDVAFGAAVWFIATFGGYCVYADYMRPKKTTEGGQK